MLPELVRHLYASARAGAGSSVNAESTAVKKRKSIDRPVEGESGVFLYKLFALALPEVPDDQGDKDQ